LFRSVRTITETSNDSVRYPELIPTLLDWYENLDAKVALPAPRDRAQMLSALARSLITPDAPTEEAFRISAIHLESAEPGSAVHLHGEIGRASCRERGCGGAARGAGGRRRARALRASAAR